MNRNPHDTLPNDHLDPLLREWHAANAARANELRERTLARVRTDHHAHGAHTAAAQAALMARPRPGSAMRLGRRLAAAALVAFAVFGVFLMPFVSSDAAAANVVMVPDGGRLVAVDAHGQALGACPLANTRVHADISGPFTRVTLVQTFKNPYRMPIEAVYTFPLSERSAVDRMRMIVSGPTGERVVDAVVKERDMARFMYEAAREQGFVASLLEQERPNIFTQSVANIEPGSTIAIEISYIETLAMKDGTYKFAFPMVVGPRYIPGQPTIAPPAPTGWVVRPGVVLLGPAAVTPTASTGTPASSTAASPQNAAEILAMLGRAVAVHTPSADMLAALGAPTGEFTATYADGSQEPGVLFASGCGSVGGRWFTVPSSTPVAGHGFAAATNQVPDAALVTPMPVRPGTRSGHDVSLSVSLDTGGPGVRALTSQQHGIDVTWQGSNRCTLALRGGSTIPNQDFVLDWTLDGTGSPDGPGVLEGVFSSAAEGDEGGFITVVMSPPAAAERDSAPVLPRELVFVVDTSGSMDGRPIEKSKEVMRRALAAMRPGDTFNIVTFAGSTSVLWPELRAATPDNVKAALECVDNRHAGGGTEMMAAVRAALVQMPHGSVQAARGDTVSVPPRTPVLPPAAGGPGTVGAPAVAPQPMRIVVFLTDGFVGNDQDILAAISENATSTRVFTFGIGGSVNRYLVEEMARRGRGACDIVLPSDSADAAVELFTRRIQTPLLRDITVSFEGIEVTDLQPSGRLLPDLFDMQPLVVHGRWAQPGTGTVVVRGQTASGPYERRLPVNLAARSAQPALAESAAPANAPMLPQLWARAKVDDMLAPHLEEVAAGTLAADIRQQVVRLCEQFHIMSPYTSFVAVERSRVVVGGRSTLVTVPIEFPEGLRWEGFFGDSWCNDAIMAAVYAAEGVTGPAPDATAAPDAHHATALGAGGAPGMRGQRRDASAAAAGSALTGIDFSGAAHPSALGGRVTHGNTAGEQFYRYSAELAPGFAPGAPGRLRTRPSQAADPGSIVENHDTLMLAMALPAPAASSAPPVAAEPPAASAPVEAAPPASLPALSAAPATASSPAAPAPRIAIPLGARDTLARVLERRLLALALYERLSLESRAETSELPDDIATLCTPRAGATHAFGSAVVALTVLVAPDTEAKPNARTEARAALEHAGFRVTGEGRGPNGQTILTGESTVESLVMLGLAPGVLRIEPFESAAVPVAPSAPPAPPAPSSPAERRAAAEKRAATQR